jgi:hypothetical protein
MGQDEYALAWRSLKNFFDKSSYNKRFSATSRQNYNWVADILRKISVYAVDCFALIGSKGKRHSSKPISWA